ncbi:MAG: hypothetical protein O2793_12255 [Proteobacteria bacterium]|nr:hypothetical protein [Pseudomonadota bacterium]MDA1254856.1 hypothetical protein [Pseudomonadota bacterium]
MCGGNFIKDIAFGPLGQIVGLGGKGQDTTKPFDAEAAAAKAAAENTKASNESIAARNKRKASTVLSNQETSPQAKTTLGG